MLRRNLAVVTAAGLAVPSVLRAQGAWPERPLRLIAPAPRDGAVDIIARILAPKLGEALGKPMEVDNRGGGSGSIGGTEAARAAPDGYTWLFAYDAEATNQTTMRLPYRTMQAFAPVGLVGTGPLVLVTAKNAPWNTLADMMAAAKRAPETIKYGTPGTGTLSHVATALLQQIGDFKLAHSPYRGGGPALQAMLAGDPQLCSVPLVAANPLLRAGTVRALGVSTLGESRHLPGVKSFAQQGFADFEAQSWWAVLGQAGTPEPILRRMSQALSATLNNPEVRAKIEEQGADVAAGGPERARRFINSEVVKWGQVIRDNNITAES